MDGWMDGCGLQTSSLGPSHELDARARAGVEVCGVWRAAVSKNSTRYAVQLASCAVVVPLVLGDDGKRKTGMRSVGFAMPLVLFGSGASRGPVGASEAAN